METDLVKYMIEETSIYNEIFDNKLTYSQAVDRCNKLWELIPPNYDVNPVRLLNLINDKYSGVHDYGKHVMKFKL